MPDRFFRSACPDEPPELPKIDTSVAHIARVYDYWLGGKDNFCVDRELADEILEIDPATIQSVRANRRFLTRAVRYAAEAGVRQFLDIGTGLPSTNNTHEVAQSVAPESKVMYVDNDPIVLAHARALLTSNPEGETGYLDADMRDPAAILTGAARLLDFAEPVCVMLLGMLHLLSDEEDPRGIIDRLMAAVPAGSYLAITHLASDVQRDMMAKVGRLLNKSLAQHVTMRSRERVAGLFDGLRLVDPGVVLAHEWRPGFRDPTSQSVLWAGVARKD